MGIKEWLLKKLGWKTKRNSKPSESISISSSANSYHQINSNVIQPTPTVESLEILVNSFLAQFQYDPQFECPFIYQEGNLGAFECVLLISKLALRHKQIKNLFPEDNTVGYFTTFRNSDAALIAFEKFAIKKAMCIESFSIFGADGDAVLNEVYSHGIGVGIYQKHLLSKDGNLFRERALQYTTESQLPRYVTQLRDFFSNMPCNSIKSSYAWLNNQFNLDLYQRLCEIMSLDSGESIRWKKEYNLYCLVKKHYSDAIYQYRAPWLGAQSLDIYIPSYHIGIEYQGIQHYKVVDFFGGVEEFEKRKDNDQKKRKKCKDNNVVLIEWPYYDDILESNLQSKFKEAGIAVPAAEKIEVYVNDINSDVELVDFIKQSLSKENLVEKGYRILEGVNEHNVEEVRKVLDDVVVHFSQKQATAFLKIVIGHDSDVIYDAICGDTELLNFWIKTGILNYYGRKILLTIEKRNQGGNAASECLKKIRLLEMKAGKNSSLKIINDRLRSEASDFGISKERIAEILRNAR